MPLGDHDPGRPLHPPAVALPVRPRVRDDSQHRPPRRALVPRLPAQIRPLKSQSLELRGHRRGQSVLRTSDRMITSRRKSISPSTKYSRGVGRSANLLIISAFQFHNTPHKPFEKPFGRALKMLYPKDQSLNRAPLSPTLSRSEKHKDN